MINISKTYNKSSIFIAIIILGVYFRISIGLQGHSIDMEHWRFLADYKKFNGHLWEFGSNAYGPVWVHVLYFLDKIYFFSINELDSLKWKIVIFLTFIDLLIFYFLLKNYSLKIATLFFLNPISIFLTGFHNGFENFAIFIGFVAVICYSKIKSNYGFLLCVVLLGVSLTTKHILFLLPFWLAIKEKTWTRKILMALVPLAIFLLSFLPWWHEESEFIIRSVFQYSSMNNGIAWSLFTPQFFNSYIGYKNLFLIALFLTGFVFEKKNKLDTFFLYLLTFFFVSSSLANQYFAIPLIAIAVYFNIYFLIFSIVSFIFFLTDHTGLNMTALVEFFQYTRNQTNFYLKIMMGIFSIGFLQHLLTAQKLNYYIKLFLKILLQKIKNQINTKIY
jgi:hypothetical protein